MSIHTLQDLCYAYRVADPVREMLFALQDRIDELEAQRKPLTDEQKAVLRECRDQAMKWTAQGRIPECGAFGAIAQDLDWLFDQLAAHGIKEGT